MSASLSREDVLRIAELARLELTVDEVDLFTGQLASILDYVDQIRDLDTSGVAATSHAIDRPLERPDVPTASMTREHGLANAPEAATEAGLFKVPRVFG